MEEILVKSWGEGRAEELKAEFEGVVLDWSGVTAKAMFGHQRYLAEGRLFAVLVKDVVCLTRLQAWQREEVDQRFDATPLKTATRTMPKWTQVTVPDESALDESRA